MKPSKLWELSNSASATKDEEKGASEPQTEEWLPKNAVFKLSLQSPVRESARSPYRSDFKNA
jgi:hypothetical protein